MYRRTYAVYILSSFSKALYIGVTNDLRRRVIEHKSKAVPSFSRRYNITRLVYFEFFQDIRLAIGREKQMKRWSRKKKVALIETTNRNWKDLARGWAQALPDARRRKPIPASAAARNTT